ncbi:MAG: glycosyltransferase [Parvibaculales bacterium]
MSVPKVSIITASFNLVKEGRGDSFLKLCQSVQEQSYDNIEHVIIDGGSEDGSLEMIKAYADNYKNVKMLSKKDNGIYQAFNRGVRKARGEYIIFIGTDDFYHDKDGIKRAVSAIERLGVDGVFSQVRVLKPSGEVHLGISSCRYLIRHMSILHPSLLLRKKTIMDMGGFDESFAILSDYKLVLGLFLAGYRLKPINNNFVSFPASGISSNGEAVSKEMARFHKEIYGGYKNYSYDEWYRFRKRKVLPLPITCKIMMDGKRPLFVRFCAFCETVRTLRKMLLPLSVRSLRKKIKAG